MRKHLVLLLLGSWLSACDGSNGVTTTGDESAGNQAAIGVPTGSSIIWQGALPSDGRYMQTVIQTPSGSCVFQKIDTFLGQAIMQAPLNSCFTPNQIGESAPTCEYIDGRFAHTQYSDGSTCLDAVTDTYDGTGVGYQYPFTCGCPS